MPTVVNGIGTWYDGKRRIHTRKGTCPFCGRLATLDPEGEIEVAFRDAKVGLEPLRGQIETSFWTRPFANRTFVINPDGAALIMQEYATYAQANPPPAPAPAIHIGQAFYNFSGMDYAFEEFPRTIQVKGHQTITKARVALAPPLPANVSIAFMVQQLKGEEQIPFGERLLQLDPSQSLVLYWLAGHHPPERMLEFLQVHLDDRPLLVEWHRVYQSLMEKVHPETDLRPRYQQILAETKGNVDALYLLGRADPDTDNGARLFQQAATANPPSGHAMYALGYRALSEGQFADAVRWLEKAVPLLAEKTFARQLYEDALLAKGDYDRLLKELHADAQQPGMQSTAWSGMLRVHAIRGDKQQTSAALAEVVQLARVTERHKTQQMMERMCACYANDVAGFLKGAGGDADPHAFESAFLRDQFPQAAALADAGKPDGGLGHALLYLAAARAGKPEDADVHWRALRAALQTGDRDERRLAELLDNQKSLSSVAVQRVAIAPERKRVLLAALAQRHPDQAKELLEMARKLDYQHDAISLCLRKVAAFTPAP